MAAPGARIEISHLTKRFGGFTAVEDLSFAVEPGRITINGRAYHDLADPLGTVGAALEATSFHPGRSGRDHLPTEASQAIVNAVQNSADDVRLEWWAAALTLAVWAAVLSGIGILFTVRRDVS